MINNASKIYSYFFFFSIFIFFNIQLKILSTSMDTNKNWTKSCTIIIMYYSHYLSIFLIILFHQSGVI